MLIELTDEVLVEFCNNYCPNLKTKRIFQKYGRLCPDCQVESYHYWLIGRAASNQAK